MKLFLSFAFLCLLCAPALAQDGNVVVNSGNSINCVTQEGERGFAAKSWSIGGTFTSNTKGEPAAASLHDLVITKVFDACSQQLIHAFLLGSDTATPKLTLIQYGPATDGRKPTALITLTLTDALINLYSVSGAPNVNPVETLNFAYRKMCITSVSQNQDGTLQPAVTVCYDVNNNKVN